MACVEVVQDFFNKHWLHSGTVNVDIGKTTRVCNICLEDCAVQAASLGALVEIFYTLSWKCRGVEVHFVNEIITFETKVWTLQNFYKKWKEIIFQSLITIF